MDLSTGSFLLSSTGLNGGLVSYALAACVLVPDADAYAIEADWRSYWERSGQVVLRNADLTPIPASSCYFPILAVIAAQLINSSWIGGHDRLFGGKVNGRVGQWFMPVR